MDALHPDVLLRRLPGADDRPRRGRPDLRRQRPELPRRAGRPVRRAGRARPPRTRRGRVQAGVRAGVLPALVLRAPAGDRAGRPAGRLRARRPEQGLLHHRRRRGRRDGVEAGQAVLQAHRQADEAQGDQPLHRLPRHAAGRAVDHRHPGREEVVRAAGARRAQGANTNFYRAPEHGDDLEAFGRWAADQIEQAIEMEGPDTVAARLPRAGAELRRLLPAAARVLPAGARDLRPARRAAGLRRGHLRVRPARHDVRLRQVRLRART